MSATSLTNNTTIAFSSVFNIGSNITSPTSTTYTLAIGHTYLVSYIVRATMTLGDSITITPRFNGVDQNNYSSKSANALGSLDVSVSGTFLVDALSGAVILDLLYNSGSTGSTPTGALSIVQIN